MGICESCLKAQEDVETVPLLGARGDAAEAELTGAQGPIKEEVSTAWAALIRDAFATRVSIIPSWQLACTGAAADKL